MGSTTRKFSPRKGCYLRDRGGSWHYRRDVPKKWRVVLGQTEWVIPLGRIPRIEAVARARVFASQHDAIIQHYERIGMHAAKQEKMAVLREMAAKAREDGVLSHTDAGIILSRELRKLDWKPSEEEQARASLAFMQAGFGAITDMEQRDITEMRIDKTEKEITKIESVKDDKTLLGVMPTWRKFRGQSDNTWRKNEERVKAFADFLNEDKALSLVTADDAHNFIEHISTTPDKHGKLRTPGTVQKYKDSLSAYFRWASKRRGWNVTNVFADIEIEKDRRDNEEQTRAPFADEQALEFRTKAFARWSRAKSVDGRGRDMMLALDLVMAFGARPAEICQLHLLNIIDDEGPVIDISLKPKVYDPEWRGSLKTKQSRRELPLPDPLIDRVLEQKKIAEAAGSRILFPTFNDTKKGYVEALNRNCSRFVKPDCSFAGNDRLVLYSHRHRFRNIATKVGVQHIVFLAIFGHGDDSAKHTDRYGSRSDWNQQKRMWLNRMYPLIFKESA